MNKSILKNGTPVEIRSLQNGDWTCLEKGFMKLSDRSRYFRFMRTTQKLSGDMLSCLADVDQVNREAICMSDLSQDPSRGVGVARYIRDAENPESAEFAIVVLDDYQGLGAGTLLLESLIRRARSNGIRYLNGITFPENIKLQRLLRKFETRIRFDGSIFQIHMELGSAQLETAV